MILINRENESKQQVLCLYGAVITRQAGRIQLDESPLVRLPPKGELARTEQLKGEYKFLQKYHFPLNPTLVYSIMTVDV